MMNSEYRFKFYLNARHDMKIENKITNIHPHTWEVNLFFRKTSDEFIQFSEVEEKLQIFLSIYENNLLNEIPPFSLIQPSLENIGEVLYEQIKRIMETNRWALLRLEISENPSRTYIIYDDNTEASPGSNNNEGKSVYFSKLKKITSKSDSEQSKKQKYNSFFENNMMQDVVNGQNVINFPLKQAAIQAAINDKKVSHQSLDQENLNGSSSNNFSSDKQLVISDNPIKEMQTVNAKVSNESSGYVGLESQNLINKNASYKYVNTNKLGVQAELVEEIGNPFNTIISTDNYGGTRVSRKHTRKYGKRRRKNKKKTSKTSNLSINEKGTSLFSIINHFFLNPVMRNIIVILLASGILITYITTRGYFPWGSDTWGHIFKGNLMYQEFMKGNFYPKYTELWYNGVQPFRYWAPLPYYIMMCFDIVTKGNVILAYNMFIVFAFIAGALGWILWGKKTGRNNFALVLALLWFFMPDNARVFFSEGNIPRVVVTCIFPYVLFYVWDYIENRKKGSFVMITICMFLITLCHAMIAGMTAITITMFIIIYGTFVKKIKNSFEVVLGIAVGIALSGFWFYPALKGGIISLDSDAVGKVMEELTFPITQSLDPLLRLSNSEIYYFGLSVFTLSLLGIILGNKKSMAGFIVTIIIFAGTTKTCLFLFKKIPMSQLFWMMRFTPLAYGVFFVGLLLWKKPKRVFKLIMILILIVDCWISVKVLCFGVSKPENLINAIKPAIVAASQRVAVLDSSEFGSFPTNYLAYNESGKIVPQVYGWAWQGAKTSQNIVWINTALEKGWYTLMFDRCLELGADTLVVKKDKVFNKNELFTKAVDAGYMKIDENPLAYVFKHPINSQFGTKVTYTGIGIGKYASNLSYIFPNIEVGGSEYLDSYTVEELQKYKVLFLSGFQYNDKTRAEGMVKELSQKGVRVIIDMTGTESEIRSSRSEFLNVMVQPVLLKNTFPVLKYGSNQITLSNFPEEYKDWNTTYLENLDDEVGQIEFNNQFMSFIGSKVNKNITFIGLNLPFYALITKDPAAINLLEQTTGMKAEEKPDRKIVEIDVKRQGDTIDVSAAQGGTSIGMAYLDEFNVKEGKLSVVDNIIKLEGTNAEIKIVTPYVKTGLFVSIIGSIILGIFLIMSNKKNSVK